MSKPLSYAAAASSSKATSAAAASSSTTTANTNTNADAAAATTNTNIIKKQKDGEEPSFLSKFKFVKPTHNPGRDDTHIQVLEPEVQRAVTVPFSTLDKKTRASAGNSDDNSDTSFPVNAKLRSILQQYGFAIVTGIYDKKGCQQLEDLWAQDLLSTISPPRDEKQAKEQSQSEFLQTIKKDPVYSWPMDKLSLGSKFASDLGLPMGRCAWACRTNDNVKKVFASIFGDMDLVTGVDNVFFDNRLQGEDDESKRTTNLWPHADQSIYAKGGDHEVYQGVLYVFEANQDTSSTVVWPGSHKEVYTSLMNSKKWENHFCPLQKARVPEFVKHARRVPVPAGGMILWSSKTIHQGYPGGPRLAVPVSMEVKALREQGAFSQKLQLCRTGLPSSHWATLALTHRLAQNNKQNGKVCEEDKSFRLEHRAHLHLFKDGDTRNPLPQKVMDMC